MRILSHAAFTSAVLFIAAGCSDQNLNKNDGDGNGSNGTTGTTGTTEPGPDYDGGCILVDGAGGYAWITDAIEVASAGSVIELCANADGAAHEEVVVVNKAVHILGPGSDAFILAPPVNEYGIVIEASGATVSGMSIVTSRTGVVVGASGATEITGVIVDDIKVYEAPNWGIAVVNAADVTIQGVELMGNVYGGISVDDSSVSILGSTLQSNTAYGVYALGGAELYLEANDIIGTVPTDTSNINDGHGVYATEGSLITTNGNYLFGNAFVNLFADSADFDMVNDEVEGALYGVAGVEGSFQLDGVSITDGFFYGGFLVSQGTVLISNLAVAGDPAVVANTADAVWNVTDDSGATERSGTGLLVQANDIQISDSTFVGYNNAGAFLLSPETGTATLARNTFTDNGRHGLYIANLQATIEDLEVTGIIEVEEQDFETACLTVDRYAGVVVSGGSLVWSGGIAADNMGYGLTGIASAINVSGTSFARNGCASVMNFGGNLEASGNTFAASVPRYIANTWIETSVIDYQGTGTVVRGNVFTDNQNELDRPTDTYTNSAGDTYYYVYRNPIGSDIFIYESGGAEIDDNSFINGTTGIQVYASETIISDNYWENYKGAAIFSSGQLEVTDNEFVDVGGDIMQCSSTSVSMEGNTVSGGGVYSYEYDYYVNDAFVETRESTSLSEAIYSSTCSISMDGDTFEDRAGSVLYVYNGDSTQTVSIEMVDVVIDTVQDNELYSYYGAIMSYAFNGATDFYLEGVEIRNDLRENGIEIYQSGTTSSASLTMVDSTIDTTGDNGVYLSGQNLVAEIDASTISNASSHGIYVAGTTQLSLTDSAVVGSGSNNIVLSSSATLTLDETAPSTATGAVGYGMICDTTVTVANCDALDLSTNGLGTHVGCEASCGDGVTTD
jgi:hypothetical protein